MATLKMFDLDLKEDKRSCTTSSLATVRLTTHER